MEHLLKRYFEYVNTDAIDQLMELNKHYKLNIEIKTVSEIVADAIVLP